MDVVSMIESMRHEKFYTSGTRCFPEIGVYCGWIAQQGSFAEAASAHAEGADVQLILAGECLRYGDTVSVDYEFVHKYRGDPHAFVSKINGLFSGLLVDRRCGRSHLFTDRYASERIYYYEKGSTVYFASEAKALLCVLPETREFDEDGVAKYLTFGCTFDGVTLFKGIRVIQGGALWTFGKETGPSKSRYFVPEEWEQLDVLSKEDFEASLEDTLRRVLPSYLEPRKQIGVSVTGGLDTRMLMALLCEEGPRPVCYTYAGLEGETLDVRIGREVARACGCEHQVLRVDGKFLDWYGYFLDRTAYVTDGCAGALQAHEVYLTTQARQLAPIRLTGNFGSEILRSMSTFKPLQLPIRLFSQDTAEWVSAAAASRNSAAGHPVTHAAFEEVPWSLHGTVAAARSLVTFRTPYLDNELVKLAYRAPAASRMSSAASLELVRRANRKLATYPTDRAMKWQGRSPAHSMQRLFAELTFRLDYLHAEGLPGWLSPVEPILGTLSKLGVLGRHKFLPYRSWYRQQLAPYLQSVLTDGHTRRMPYWNTNYLDTLAARHRDGTANHLREIGTVLTLEAVDRMLINGCQFNRSRLGEKRDRQ
jgi:asparagine synthase (glutamine-hydrolysing)